MAYACPVCAEPQVDGEHLANHLAFTAITGDDAHEEWLDATVEDWGQLGETELAEIAVDHAEETEFPVDVDAADVAAANDDHGNDYGPDHRHDHGHGDGTDRGDDHGVDVDAAASSRPAALDEDARDVLEEARELSRRMAADDGGDSAEGESATETDSSGVDSSDSETQ